MAWDIYKISYFFFFNFLLNSNNEAVITLSTPIMVAAGETVTLDVVASMDADGDTGHVNKLNVTSIELMDGSVSWTPVMWNLMRVTAYQVADIKFDSNGSNTTYDVGEEAVVVWEFDLEVSWNNDKDAVLNYIRLKNSGNADLSSLES